MAVRKDLGKRSDKRSLYCTNRNDQEAGEIMGWSGSRKERIRREGRRDAKGRGEVRDWDMEIVSLHALTEAFP